MFYGVKDIQCILNKITEDVDYKKRFLKKTEDFCNNSDYLSICNVISEGYYEAFDGYDSDVCEQFLTIFESLGKEM